MLLRSYGSSNQCCGRYLLHRWERSVARHGKCRHPRLPCSRTEPKRRLRRLARHETESLACRPFSDNETSYRHRKPPPMAASGAVTRYRRGVMLRINLPREAGSSPKRPVGSELRKEGPADWLGFSCRGPAVGFPNGPSRPGKKGLEYNNLKWEKRRIINGKSW